jgi:hypothetical protein
MGNQENPQAGNYGAAQREKQPDPEPAKLWPLIVGASLAVLVAAAVGYFVFLFVLDTYKVVPSEAAKTAVTLVGVPTAAGAVFVALRNLRLKEKQLHTDQLRLAESSRAYDLAFDTEHNRRSVDRDSERRARYVSAADQIGHSSAAVRLAGVNAMAQLATDWEEQRQACVDVLCAYLRLPQMRGELGRLDEADAEVRRTAQSLLARGFKGGSGVNSTPPWPDLDLDLRGAVLRDFRMPRCRAKRAIFTDAEFIGSTTFIGSHFLDAVFTRASFEKAVTFSGCDFGRASFRGVRFGSTARFRRASFQGMAHFDRSSFSSQLDLTGVTSRRKLRFANTSFVEHPQYEGEGYDTVISRCTINQDPIGDRNVRGTWAPSEDDDADFLLEEGDWIPAGSND